MMEMIEERILVPSIHTMKRNRKPFRGVLYAGLMLTQAGPKTLEFNVRFGDPECQPLIMRLKSDLMDILEATVDGCLDSIADPVWDPRPAICVVVASQGYPGDYEKGKEITGLDAAAKLEDVKVFHAGTSMVDGRVLTDGGRVLGVTAVGSSISAAKLQAYTACKWFDGQEPGAERISATRRSTISRPKKKGSKFRLVPSLRPFALSNCMDQRAYLISKMASTSTAEPVGICAKPSALRA